MRTRKLLQKTLAALGIPRAELEHLVECDDCFDPFDSERAWYCEEYKRKFQGWTPPPPPNPEQARMTSQLQRLWQQEILNQAAPVLRFEEIYRSNVERFLAEQMLNGKDGNASTEA